MSVFPGYVAWRLESSSLRAWLLCRWVMPLYTMLLEATQFQQEIVPPLTESWRRRSFRPCAPLLARLQPAAEAFASKYHIPPGDLCLLNAGTALPFDRHYWQHLVSEILMVAAMEIPEIELDLRTLGCLVAPATYDDTLPPREEFSAIQQSLFGTRDLAFGVKRYRPDKVGLNNIPDVRRLADYLSAVDRESWNSDDLQRLTDLEDIVERTEELEAAREAFALFVDVYRRAAREGRVIVAEIL